jgi:CDP-diacylglycerol--glycerol-3-phosphate 3-phosphatidyltransferase
MLDVRARKNVSRVVDPVARLVARIGVTPTMVTLTGFAMCVAGSVLIGTGRLAVGASILGGGALFDILDGVLARVTGKESDRGALLDSFTDRLGEVAMWTGLAYYLGDAAAPGLVTLSIVAACGSLLIPYLRARAEGLGVDGKGGWFGRAERLLVFGLGVGLAGLDLPTLEPTLWVLAVGTWVTVVQRFIQTWHRLPG